MLSSVVNQHSVGCEMLFLELAALVRVKRSAVGSRNENHKIINMIFLSNTLICQKFVLILC